MNNKKVSMFELSEKYGFDFYQEDFTACEDMTNDEFVEYLENMIVTLFENGSVQDEQGHQICGACDEFVFDLGKSEEAEEESIDDILEECFNAELGGLSHCIVEWMIENSEAETTRLWVEDWKEKIHDEKYGDYGFFQITTQKELRSVFFEDEFEIFQKWLQKKDKLSQEFADFYTKEEEENSEQTEIKVLVNRKEIEIIIEGVEEYINEQYRTYYICPNENKINKPYIPLLRDVVSRVEEGKINHEGDQNILTGVLLFRKLSECSFERKIKR